jgi:4-amino-4-deoxy-L-arabinose transferase-like glycosyltransferase
MTSSTIDTSHIDAMTEGQPPPSCTRRRRLILAIILIFTAALAIRLLFCFVAVPLSGIDAGPNSQEFYTATDGYLDLAVNLVEHGRLAFSPEAPPTTFRGFPYPLALAIAYAVTGDITTAALIVNSLASSVTCALVYCITGYVLGRRPPIVLIVPVVCFPLSIWYCANSFSDTFFAMTFVAYVWSVLRLFHRPRSGNGVISGLCLAMAAITKPIVLPLAALVTVYAALRHRSAVQVAVLALVLGYGGTAAWIARNAVVAGHWMPPSSGLGFNTLAGNLMIPLNGSPGLGVDKSMKSAIEAVQRAQGRQISREELKTAGHWDMPYSIDRLFRDEAVVMFRQHPQLLPKKIAINMLRFWYFSSGPLKSAANLIVNFSVLLLAIPALAKLARTNRHAVELIALFVLTMALMYSAIIVNSSRYCLPVIILLPPYAAITVIRAFPRLRARWLPDSD